MAFDQIIKSIFVVGDTIFLAEEDIGEMPSRQT